MGTRLELQDILEHVFVDVGEWLWGSTDIDLTDVTSAIAQHSREHVYFQPPSNIQMKYPCIVYELDNIDIRYADNLPYKHKNRYTITVIDKNPDSKIPWVIQQLPMVSFRQRFANDNLYHTVFQLYF